MHDKILKGQNIDNYTLSKLLDSIKLENHLLLPSYFGRLEIDEIFCPFSIQW